MNISSATTSDIIDLLGREGTSMICMSLDESLTGPIENTLKALFGVSGVSLSDRTVNEVAPTWQYKETLEVEGDPLYSIMCQSEATNSTARDGD